MGTLRVWMVARLPFCRYRPEVDMWVGVLEICLRNKVYLWEELCEKDYGQLDGCMRRLVHLCSYRRILVQLHSWT